MEIAAKIKDERFCVSPLENGYFFVSGKQNSYIIYKSRKWRCADEIHPRLLKKLGEVIEEHFQLTQ